MTRDLPDWHRLIMAWLAKGNYGLTIPFIVGARAYLNGMARPSRSNIDEFFREVIESPVPNHIVYARWCGDMESIVMASYPVDFPQRPTYDILAFRTRDGETDSMIIEKSLAKKLGVNPNVQEVLEALVLSATSAVAAGNYSKFWTIHGKETGPFRKADIKFIKMALRKNAP